MIKAKFFLTYFIFNFFVITFFLQAQQSMALSIENPISKDPAKGIAVSDITGSIVKGILGLVGILSLAYFIYGGFVWMTAGGNNDQVEKGKKIIYWATAGLTAIFASYAVLSMILETLVAGV